MITNPLTAERTFVCYTHTMNEQPLFVGACRMSELMNAPDARQNSEWARLVTPQSVLSVNIVSQHMALDEAKTAAIIHAFNTQAYCNMHGRTLASVKRTGNAITCNETGETFNSISEAARRHNVTQSALSAHINGKRGHLTVKGKTYRREQL